MTVGALSAAKRLGEVSGWSLTNLHIQKLLYLAHMVYMGESEGEPLVTGHFEAWAFGPVHPPVYHAAKVCADRPVIPSVFHSSSDLDEDDDPAKYLDRIYDEVPLERLVRITHWEQGAWYKHYHPHIRGIVIPNSDILEEYRKRVDAAKAKTDG